MSAEINLRDGRVCLVDEADLPLLRKFKWWSAEGAYTHYAVTIGPDGRQTMMHSMLLPHASEVDHANGNGLDNRRSNIRACSHAENMRNRRKNINAKSRFKGVWPARNGKWRAMIEQSGEKLVLGTFQSEAQAAAQYDRAARLFFGKFARTNEMLGLYTDADRLELALPPVKAEKKTKPRRARKPLRWAKQMMTIGIVPRVAARA